MGWDDNGLPTERRVQNYYGVRCDPSLPYDPTFDAAGQARPRPSGADLAPQLHRAVPRPDARGREGLRGTVPPPRPVGRLDATATPPSTTTASESRNEPSSATSPGARPTNPKRRACGTSRSAPRSRRPSSKTKSGPARTTRSRSIVSTAVAICSIDTTRPELLAACVALVAHPDDDRYKPLFGTTVRTPVFDVEVPVVAHHLADPEKGTGIAMICTFGDTTDVTWWRELQPARAAPIVGRDGRIAGRAARRRSRTARGATPTRSSPARPSPAAQREDRRAACASRASSSASHARSRTRSSSTSGATSRSRSSPRASGTSATAAATKRCATSCSTRGAELNWVPPYMRGRYEIWVRRPQRRLARQPPAVLRRADPAVVPHSTATANPHLRSPDRARRRHAARRSVSARAARLHRRATGQARRLHRRPRRHGHLGHVVAHAADRVRAGSTTPTCSRRTFPMDLRPQAHDIIRTWLFSTVVRAAPRTRQRAVDATPRCPAGSSTPTARRCRSPRATSSRRCTCSSSTAPTPCATGRPVGSARHRHRVRRRPDEGRAPPRDQAAQRVEVRARLRRRHAADPALVTAPARPRDARRARPHSSTNATTAFDALRLRPSARTHRDVLLELLRRLRRARQGPRLRRRRRRATVGRGAALRLALSTLLRLFAPILPFVTEEVWSWWQPGSIHRAPWPDVAELGAIHDVLPYTVAAETLAEIRKAKSEQKKSLATPVAHVEMTDTAERLAALRLAIDDVVAAGKVAAPHDGRGRRLRRARHVRLITAGCCGGATALAIDRPVAAPRCAALHGRTRPRS